MFKLTSRSTIPPSWTRVTFLKILMVIFDVPSICSTSPEQTHSLINIILYVINITMFLNGEADKSSTNIQTCL